MQVGFDYNDEYYSTASYGTTYDAPDKVFTDKEKAILELDRQSIEMIRKEDLSGYGGNGISGICKNGMQDEFIKIYKEEFGRDVEDSYDYKIPKSATDEQIKKVMECLSLKFYELVEVDIEVETN